MILKNSKIYIAGHTGMVGSACWEKLESEGFNNLIGKTSKELDLRNQKLVFDFISNEKPDVVIIAAAKVGGILANNNDPYNFLLDNMLIQNNLIKTSHDLNISKLIFLGSSCIYPKLASQPLKEEYLLSGFLEPTNEWYAIAKISGIKLIEAIRKQFKRDYISLMPTNLYGPNDNFDLNTSHVLPAMIRKFHEAKINNNSTVKLWGSGTPMREFLYVKDLADAVFFSMFKTLNEPMYNVGYGSDISIKDLSKMIQEIVGHNAKIIWDKKKPDGTPKKLLDNSKIFNLGWKPKINLKDGIILTYEWYIKNLNKIFN